MLQLKSNIVHHFQFAVIDVCTGEYGHDYIDKMISSVDNGRCLSWMPYDAVTDNNYRNEKISAHSPFIDELEEEINPKHLRARSSSWEQFWTLYKRRTVQMWRDSVNIKTQSIHQPHKLKVKIMIGSIVFFSAELRETKDLYDILSRFDRRRHLSRHR